MLFQCWNLTLRLRVHCRGLRKKTHLHVPLGQVSPKNTGLSWPLIKVWLIPHVYLNLIFGHLVIQGLLSFCVAQSWTAQVCHNFPYNLSDSVTFKWGCPCFLASLVLSKSIPDAAGCQVLQSRTRCKTSNLRGWRCTFKDGNCRTAGCQGSIFLLFHMIWKTDIWLLV